eukprot:COSAG01_NODE_6948_length_3426_cov_3.373910_5_plen_54_part_00
MAGGGRSNGACPPLTSLLETHPAHLQQQAADISARYLRRVRVKIMGLIIIRTD